MSIKIIKKWLSVHLRGNITEADKNLLKHTKIAASSEYDLITVCNSIECKNDNMGKMQQIVQKHTCHMTEKVII